METDTGDWTDRLFADEYTGDDGLDWLLERQRRPGLFGLPHPVRSHRRSQARKPPLRPVIAARRSAQPRRIPADSLVGVSITFLNNWNFNVQYIEFTSPSNAPAIASVQPVVTTTWVSGSSSMP